MRYLNKITDKSHQRFILTGNGGASINMTLRFLPVVQHWVMDLEQGDFVARGLRIVTSPNMLRCFKNVIDFGIMVTSPETGIDPYQIDDFLEQRNNMYLLDANDVLALEAGFNG